LLFVRAEEGRTSLYRISVVGGEPQKVIENAQAGDWSPDGKRIVFLRPREERGRAVGSIVGVAGVDGSGERRIAEETELLLFSPRWSPDGRTIGVVRSGGAVSIPDQVTLFDAESRKRRSLPSSKSGGTISSFAWTDGGERILYAQSADLTGFVHLSRVLRRDVRSGDTRTLLWVPNIVSSLDVLRPGAVVFDALVLPQNLREIPILRTEKGAGQWLTRGNSADRQPVYSPDGEWIVYSSSRSGNIDIWQVGRKSGTVRRLTQDPADDWDPGFTRDGKTLLFSSNRGGHFEIWAAEADGRRARQLTHDGYDAENPTATPDGRWIVYSSGHPGKRGVWKVRADGSGAVRLVADAEFHPEVSPDGQYVLYHTPPDPGWTELRVIRTEDGKPVDFRIRMAFPGAQAPTVLFRSVGSLGRARWMPDGRAIAFVAVDDRGRPGVMVQDFAPGRDTSASRRPLAGFDGELNAESLGISPDGARLVVSSVGVSSGIMLAEGLPGVAPPRRDR
jgi:Tol biopolymer transport system component